MRTLFAILIVVPVIAYGQYRSQTSTAFAGSAPEAVQSGDSTGGGFLGLDLSRLTMRQSASFSMMSGGGQSLGVSAFTNTFLYDVSPVLRARADVSLLNTPLNTLGSAANSQLNGIQLSNLSLNYKPANNLNVVVSMQRGPMMMNGMMNSMNTFEDEEMPREGDK